MGPQLRPRDRLLRQGPGSLTDAELIAVLMRAGPSGVPSEEIAEGLIRKAGDLESLLKADRRLLKQYGATDSKAAVLLAIQELACRALRKDVRRRLIRDPSKAVDYLMMRYGIPDQEVLGAIYLDFRNRLIAEQEIFRGTICRAAVEPRQILRLALHHRAASFIVWHTHPGGDPTPSEEDRNFTLRLAKASKLLGVRLVDHLVLGTEGSWTSLQRC